jgi:hypothetical protein
MKARWMAVLSLTAAAGLSVGWVAGKGKPRSMAVAVEPHAAPEQVTVSQAASSSFEVRESARAIRQIPKKEKQTSASDLVRWMGVPPEAGSDEERRFSALRQELREQPNLGFDRLRDLATGLLAEGREVEARTVLQWMKEVRTDSRTQRFLEDQAVAAMSRPREGVDSGVLTAIALAEALEQMGASDEARRQLASKLLAKAANSADADVIRARLWRGLASH